MIARELLDTAQIPSGGGELRLYKRELKGNNEFSIMLGRIELMNSRLSGSEEALADLSCEKIIPRPRPHVLIGGFGMGFTLRAAIKALPADARITVAELIPAVVKWARGPMHELCGDVLEDPRVEIIVGDVCNIIAQASNEYDAILLDVDNGPDGLTHESNDRLYNMAGLQASKSALKSGGVLAVWSSEADSRFTRRLQKARLIVEEHTVSARQNGKGARHMIWLATKG
ncbi:MAG: hypothetical protein V7676_09115 [Parasphingorhabdus sp.]|uniref:spermidine synthase n=1 Tax=Parasphingorhabdus sp. TaxID=2709688 RepID=UPI0030026D21